MDPPPVDNAFSLNEKIHCSEYGIGTKMNVQDNAFEPLPLILE